jgi:cation transport ATPase
MVAAFVPSTISTIAGTGEVYFDSVTMFIAFLLTARFFENRAAQSVDVANLQQGLHQRLQQLCMPILARADRVATVFVLAQLALSLVVTIVWWQLQPEHALSVLVALLVMSCPCALSLAAPVSLAATHATLAAHPQITPEQAAILFSNTRRITYQNLYGALAWHLLTMPLAAFGLVTPWIAALAMFISSVAVMGNAWRLYRIPNATGPTTNTRDYSAPAGLV